MPLLLVGLNHHTAPLPIRERVSYSPAEAELVLRELTQSEGVGQAMLLSTCNRTELYVLSTTPAGEHEALAERVFYQRLGEKNGHGDLLYVREDAAAVNHLFRVACGLESLVLGEQEILAQVKSAYEISRNAEAVGSVFHRLANRTFKVAKQARTATKIGMGAVSVASAAIELAGKVLGSLEGRGAVLVGAGQNGALCAQHLLAHGANPLVICNRSRDKAAELAASLQAEAAGLDELSQVLPGADVVVSTTGAPHPVIGTELVREAMEQRGGKPMVFVDIAVPRDVDPEVENLKNVFRFDMESLGAIVDQNVDRRRTEVPAVERIVEAEVDQFMRWWQSLGSGQVLRDLHRHFDNVRTVEIQKNAKRFKPEDHKELEVFSQSLIRKMLSGVTSEIKGYRTDDPVAQEKLATLRELFHLDEDEEGES